jgi:hypothetical protein
MKKVVSYNFRKYCLDRYPLLKDNVSYRRLFNYICFSTFLDKDSKRIIISSKVLCGCEKKVYNNHYNGIKFLKEFKRDILCNLEWSKHDFEELKPRMIINDGIDDELRNLINLEFISQNIEKKVYFITGEVYNAVTKAKYINIDKEEYKVELEEIPYEYNTSQKTILDYMNNINSLSFIRKVNENKDKINEVLSSLDFNTRINQQKILHSFFENYDIKYSHSREGNTSRLFARKETILSLKSEVRKAACSGWTDFDIQCSQFSIISEILNAPLSKALIKDRKNLWAYLNYFVFGDNGVPTKELKSIFKQIIYGISYGQSICNLRKFAEENNILKILECDIIIELLTLRKDWAKKINSDGYVYDVWNNKICLALATKTKKEIWFGSLASQKIQSIELEIMKFLFDFANENEDRLKFKIMIFQHDGVCISFYDKAKKELATKEIQKYIYDKSKDIGYTIYLDAQDL